MRDSKRLIFALGLAIVAGLVVQATPVDAQVYATGRDEIDPTTITKYVDPLVIPPAMPRTSVITMPMGKKTNYYEIAERQFDQQILPSTMDGCDGAPCPTTTVWSYGSVQFPGSVFDGGSFFYPALTIEARWQQPTRVRWSNELVVDPIDCYYGSHAAESCEYLPHLLPVDQTLHWANPAYATGCAVDGEGTDCRTNDPTPYTGPVPMIVHLHGAETTEDSDGYPEAWYLPAASNLDGDYATGGSLYQVMKDTSPFGDQWGDGAAVFEYPNTQEATTLWFHDHSLGMTRLNVYAGPAGFYLLRGGPSDEVLDSKGKPATLPGPAPQLGDPAGMDYYEIPIVIQDRSFFADDGSLAYPDNRAFFEGVDPVDLQIPFIGDPMDDSDVSPIWNPEFFGNTIVVNGRTWPYLEVEQRRYRFRFLNGTQSRFLILQFEDPSVDVWQIGAEQGFLPYPVNIGEGETNDVPGGILLGPAERADMVVDFSALAEGTTVRLLNFAPDEPFGGGDAVFGCDDDDCFEPADDETTGQVMEFRVVKRKGADKSTPPADLVLPAPPVLGAPTATRELTLNEEESQLVLVAGNEEDEYIIPISVDPEGIPFGPTEALLGVLDGDSSIALGWAAQTTENVAHKGDTEVWEIYNFTADAHPIHIHLIQFQVINREGLEVDDDGNATATTNGEVRQPEPWETGYKDTVIAYPGEVTRVKAEFPLAGLFVWHCHILEHEDNEMMRPYCVADADGNFTAACNEHNGW